MNRSLSSTQSTERFSKLEYRIIPMRDRAMTGLASCAQPKTCGSLFRRLHRVVPPLIDLKAIAATLVEGIFRLNQLRTMLDYPARSLPAADLLIGGCHKD